MTNWYYNTLNIIGPHGDLKTLLEQARVETEDEELPFSFEALLPTPAELFTTAHGDDAWSRWRSQNWGMEADVDAETFDEGDLHPLDEVTSQWTATFVTMWDPPVAGIEGIARRYPTLTFRIGYSEFKELHVGGARFHGTERQEFVLDPETQTKFAGHDLLQDCDEDALHAAIFARLSR